MPQDFQPGDFLIFQLESGFGLLRVLGLEGDPNDPIWHLAAYRDLFLDVDMADMVLENPGSLTIELPHVALTNRAFESTQVAKMSNASLEPEELTALESWRSDPAHEISDRSIRLLLGLR